MGEVIFGVPLDGSEGVIRVGGDEADAGEEGDLQSMGSPFFSREFFFPFV